MANGENLDVNSMYSILKDIFNREYNENYSNRNRSGFAGGLADLRNGWAAMQNARKNKQDQAEYKNSMSNGGGNKYPNGSIGATGDGVYGVNSMPPQSNGGGIGADANGVYGVNGATPQPNKYTFNESDYIPSAQNGYHLGNYPQTEMYGSPTDFQRQMASNAIGYNLGSFEPRQQTWFPKDNANGGGGFDWGKTSPMPKENSAMDAWKNQGGNSMFSGMGGGEKPDNTMNITSQTIGNNYNGRIDGQVGGLGIPQSPQGGSGFNSVFNGANANPYQPSISSSDVAQRIGGQGNVSANDLSQYLGNEYNRARWIQDDMANNGVTNPLISMLRYDTKIAPLVNAAKEDELRNAFFVLQNPQSSDQDKMNAIALIQYRKGDPYLEENQQMKRDKAMYDMGYLPEGDFGYGDSDGGEYGGDDANAGAIYSHLASKGVPANVIAGIMGNLQAESGFNSSAVGDNGQSIGLAQWYDSRGNNLRNFAQQRGKDWTDIPTQVDFLLSEIQQSNPDLLQRMSKLSPHDAAILFHDEFEKSADSPEMKDRRGQYAEGIYGNRRQGGNRNGRYRRDPYRVSPREQFNYNQQRDAMNYALGNRAIDARLAAKIGAKNGKINSANGLWSSDDDIIGIFNKGALKENPKSGQAMLSIVGQFAPKYRELVQRGLPPEQAKGAIQAALIKQLGADNIANMGQANFNDMMDSIINGTSSVAQQKNNSSQGGASGSVDESVIDNIKAKGWDVIKNMIPENRENLNPDPYRNDVEDTAFEKADARRRLIEAARKEGLEFDEYTNELRPIGGRWGNLFNSREKQEEINRKIASFKSRYAI